MKNANEGPRPQKIAPAANNKLENPMHDLGENIWHKRPASGDTLDAAI
jgi:hypothetical protein